MSKAATPKADGFKFGGKKVTREGMKIAVRWARDEISGPEMRDLFGDKHTSTAVYHAGIALREAVRAGILK